MNGFNQNFRPRRIFSFLKNDFPSFLGSMNRKVDIALFVGNMEVGGAERMMLHLAQGFVARGLTVDLILVRATGPNLQSIPPNVRVVDLNCAHSRSSIWKLVSYLRRERPRAMLSTLDMLNVIAILAKWLSGSRTRLAISITCFISLVYDPKNADVFTRSISARITFSALKFLYRFANRIVAISSGVADDCAKLANIPRSRIEVFYLPVITPNLHERAREPISHAWFRPEAPPVIIAVGRLSKAKDYPTLINAFAILLKRKPARLLILGEGECRRELEQLVYDLGLVNEISIPGYVDNQYAFISHASVLALSSAWEGLSNVLVEALACGTQVVSTDCFSGPREILEDGKWGKLVPVGDASALALALEETLASGVAAASPPAEILERFSLEPVVNKYCHLLLG